MVTGASGGIGSAISKSFAEEGARLVLHYRQDRAGAERVARALPTDCITVRADLTRESQARLLFARATRRFGRVDTVVANAGSWETRPIPLHDAQSQE